MFGKRKELDEWGRKIEVLRDEIPVNRDLKLRLRAEFESSPTASRRKPTLALVAVLTAAMALALWLGLGNRENGIVNPVLAADLKIVDQVSLVDIASGSNLPPVIGNDKIYIPVADQGTFSVPIQSGKGATIKRVTDSTILFSSLSHDGKTAACVNSRGIYLYDLESGKSNALIEGNDYDLFYEEPSWSADDKSLLVTRKQVKWLEHGHKVRSLGIYEIDRNGKNLRKITSGSYASYIPGSRNILFERDGKIFVREPSGEEHLVDVGRFPAASPDGLYIAYVKSIREEKKISETARVITDLSDVYICSVNNFADGRKLTANYPYRYINEEEWAEGLNPAHGEQSLVFSGMYDFYNPVWGTDPNTLYVLKGGNSENIPTRITRINLGPKALAAEETVARYLEAGITRDDDFARSLLTDPQGYLTISNPHPVAYSITGSGEENGRTYIDAWQTEAYNTDAYYRLNHIRLYLVKGKEGYKIERIVDREGGIEVLGRQDGIYIRKIGEEHEDLLLQVKGITQAGTPDMRRLSSLAYSPEKQILLYTIQELESFIVIAHDLKQNKELFSQQITDEGAVVLDLSFDGSHQYAAIRYYGDSHHKIKLFDVLKKTFVDAPFLDNAMNAYWAGEKLLVEKPEAGGTIRWMYDPRTGTAVIGV